MKTKEKPTTVRGIILAAGWDINGAISDVNIAGYDEKSYRVVNDEMGKQLRACIKKRVIADGIVMTQNDRLTIQVHHFHIDSLDSNNSAG